MMSDEQLEKFHNKDNMSLCYPDLGSASDWLKQISIVAQLKLEVLDLVSEVSSMRNFCARSSDVILWGGGGGGTSEMLAVFSCCFCSACFLALTLFERKWPLWVDSHANE